MAEQQQTNSKGIGELFIEFGSKGLPSLLKGLNTVSASFLLTKNAAEQFSKPFKEMFSEAGKDAVGIGKMSALLGASVKDVQKITNYFKEKNVDPASALSGIAKLQSAIYDIQSGRGGLDNNMNRAFSLLGIDIWDYNKELESTLQLVEDIQTATKNLNPVDRQAHLRDIGIPEFGYLFERGEFNKSDVFTLSADEVEKLQEAQEATNKASQALKQAKNTMVSRIAPTITQGANTLTDTINKAEKGDKLGKAQSKGLAGSTILGAGTGASLGIGGGLWGMAAGAVIGGAGGFLSGIGVIDKGNKLKDRSTKPQSTDGQPTGFATPIVPPSMQGTAHIPPNLHNTNTSVTYANTFHITGSNAEEIGQEVKNQLDIQALEFNQFQLENLPGR